MEFFDKITDKVSDTIDDIASIGKDEDDKKGGGEKEDESAFDKIKNGVTKVGELVTGGDEKEDEPSTPLGKLKEDNKAYGIFSDVAHTVLDVAGFIPGAGAVPDLLNAGLHAAEGDKSEAALSAVAAIPFAGDAVKGGVTAGKAGDKVSDALKGGDEAGDVADATKKGKGGSEDRDRSLDDAKDAGDKGKDNDDKVAGDKGKDNDDKVAGDKGKDNDDKVAGDKGKDNDDKAAGDKGKDNDDKVTGDKGKDNDDKVTGDKGKDNDDKVAGDKEKDNEDKTKGTDKEEGPTKTPQGAALADLLAVLPAPPKGWPKSEAYMKDHARRHGREFDPPKNRKQYEADGLAFAAKQPPDVLVKTGTEIDQSGRKSTKTIKYDEANNVLSVQKDDVLVNYMRPPDKKDYFNRSDLPNLGEKADGKVSEKVKNAGAASAHEWPANIKEWHGESKGFKKAYNANKNKFPEPISRADYQQITIDLLKKEESSVVDRHLTKDGKRTTVLDKSTGYIATEVDGKPSRLQRPPDPQQQFDKMTSEPGDGKPNAETKVDAGDSGKKRPAPDAGEQPPASKPKLG